MTLTNNPPSFYAIIPAHVRYCKDLEPNAKLFYGEITALAGQYGYCWASNEYFAQLYDVDVRTIKRWLKSLQTFGFISVEITKKGITVERKIWISPEVKKMFTKGQKCPDRGDKNVPRGTPSPYIYNNTYKNSSSAKRTPPQPILFDENTRNFTGISDEDIKAWKEKFPTIDVEKQIALCAEWALGEPRKSYRKSLLAWLNHSAKTEKKAVDTTQEDKKLAEKIWNKFKGRKEQDIELGYKYLEFKNGMTVAHIEFGQQDFKEKIKNELKRRKLNIEGL